MYVEPNSTVYLMKNVPLDPTYQHTVLFSSKEQQANTFLGYTTGDLTFVNQSYQRHGRGYIKIATNVGNILNCNYMMFRNYNSDTMTYDRWFYAFITDVEYVNEATTLIRYEIDIMQTWLFDYSLDPVFVEREHSTTDNVGDNLLDESLERGEYIFRSFNPSGHLGTSFGVVIYSTYDPTTKENVTGGKYSNLYSAAKPFYFATPAEANSFLDSCTTDAKAPDCIVGVCMCPTMYASVFSNPAVPSSWEVMEITKPYTDIDNYVPKNKKLFTYPYNFLYVTNLMGSNNEYRYELFNTTKAKLNIGGAPSLSMDIMCAPENYKLLDDKINFNEAVFLTDIPMCCYSVDAFNAWFAQNKGTYITGKVTQALGTIAAGVTAGPKGALTTGVSLFNEVLSTVGELRDKSVQPPNVTGSPAAGSLYGQGAMDFWIGQVNIQQQYAIIIDQYWSKFGYPCRKIKVPNRNARANWNYVKTQGCEFTGSIPASDAEAIKSIYDNGVTFWNNINNVGKYGDFTNPINA